jgi:hypothetical protein
MSLNYEEMSRSALIEKIKNMEKTLNEEREEYKKYYSVAKYCDKSRAEQLLQNNKVLMNENIMLKSMIKELENKNNKCITTFSSDIIDMEQTMTAIVI